MKTLRFKNNEKCCYILFQYFNMYKNFQLLVSLLDWILLISLCKITKKHHSFHKTIQNNTIYCGNYGNVELSSNLSNNSLRCTLSVKLYFHILQCTCVNVGVTSFSSVTVIVILPVIFDAVNVDEYAEIVRTCEEAVSLSKDVVDM